MDTWETDMSDRGCFISSLILKYEINLNLWELESLCITLYDLPLEVFCWLCLWHPSFSDWCRLSSRFIVLLVDNSVFSTICYWDTPFSIVWSQHPPQYLLHTCKGWFLSTHFRSIGLYIYVYISTLPSGLLGGFFICFSFSFFDVDSF